MKKSYIHLKERLEEERQLRDKQQRDGHPRYKANIAEMRKNLGTDVITITDEYIDRQLEESEAYNKEYYAINSSEKQIKTQYIVDMPNLELLNQYSSLSESMEYLDEMGEFCRMLMRWELEHRLKDAV